MVIILLGLYILVWLLATNALVVWFRSSMSVKILKSLKMIPKDTFTNEDAFTHLLINYGLVGELLSCPICLATWLSAGFAFLVLAAASALQAWPLIIISALTLPFLSTSVLNKWH